MLSNLVYGIATMLLCLLLQGVLLLVALRYYINRGKHTHRAPTVIVDIVDISGVMLLLVIGNLAQVAIWATLFVYLDEFAVFSDAFYHSMVNFATLGYGDVVMSDKHKLLGPMEAINGVLMIGVSTAALLSAFQHKLRTLAQHGG